MIFNLVSKGWDCRCIIAREPSNLRESLLKYKIKKEIGKEEDLGANVFIAVRDDAINEVAMNLSESGINFKDINFFHFSGALTSDVLSPIKKKDGFIASLHPLYSFSDNPAPLPEGILLTFEGDNECYDSAVQISEDIKAVLEIIDKTNKPLYHFASVLGVNMSMTLLYTASKLISKSLNDNREGHKESLIVLLRSAIRNIENAAWKDGLTGPVSRGDMRTIGEHIKALEAAGETELMEIYRMLRELTVKMIDGSK